MPLKAIQIHDSADAEPTNARDVVVSLDAYRTVAEAAQAVRAEGPSELKLVLAEPLAFVRALADPPDLPS
jgi:hypothetical protein